MTNNKEENVKKIKIKKKTLNFVMKIKKAETEE